MYINILKTKLSVRYQFVCLSTYCMWLLADIFVFNPRVLEPKLRVTPRKSWMCNAQLHIFVVFSDSCEAALNFFCINFPETAFGVAVRPIVLQHQLYSVIRNNSKVDQEVVSVGFWLTLFTLIPVPVSCFVTRTRTGTSEKKILYPYPAVPVPTSEWPTCTRPYPYIHTPVYVLAQ